MDIILGMLYLPLTLFAYLSGMAIEGVMTQSAPSAVFIAYALGYTGPLVAFAAYPCLIASIILRRHGKKRLAVWLRFAPPLVLGAIWSICILAEWIL